MEIIDRYIYAVIQRLPEQQRAEIKQELQGLIEDMLAERTPADQASQEDAKRVLQELGHPNVLAAKYRGYDRYLIGPMMFEPYMTTVKIVLISISIALTVMFAIETIFSTTGILEHFTSYLVSLIAAGTQGFVWVTIVFAFIEYRQQKNDDNSGSKHKEWEPSDLPRISDKNTQIKTSEPIVGIFFTILFTALFLYAIELLGVWRFNDGGRMVIRFLNADAFRNYLPIVWMVAALGIFKGCIRIIVRKRTSKMLAFNILMSVATTVLVCIILADPAIWNPDFIQELEVAGVLSVGGKDYDTVVSIWSGVNEWLITLIVLFVLIDIISEIHKWYRVKKLA